MKKRLEEAKGRWPEELPNVLWSYRTTARTSTGHTPFALAYGCEAMLPIEVEVPTRRHETYNQEENHALLEESLDLIEETRRNSQLINAAYQQKMTQYFNKKVRGRQFLVGDLVLRRVFAATRDPNAGVLGPNWEGPYEVETVIRPGTYKLARLGGGLVPRAWNAEHLKKYYQ